MAAAAEERVVVAAEETVTSVRSTASSTSNGGASVTTTTTTSTSRFGRLFGWGGGATEAQTVEEEATTTTVTTTTTTTTTTEALPQLEEAVGTPASGSSRPPSLRKDGSAGASGSKRRTLSFLGPTASGTAPVGLPSEAHKEVFAALRARVVAEAAEDNVAPFNSEDYLNRVLVARNLDVDAAFKMWQGIVAWRKEYKPEVLSEEDAAPYLAQGVISRCGPDKYGHPCMYAASKNHWIDSGERHEKNLRTIVHMLDATKQEATEKGNGFIAVIIDQDQCGRKNMDTHLFIGRPGLVHILQDFYPETLAAAYIMHTSWLFRAVWAIISPFLDEKTRSKVKVLAKTEDILEHFDVEVLPPSIQEKLGHVPK